jgi:hypothetical protein
LRDYSNRNRVPRLLLVTFALLAFAVACDGPTTPVDVQMRPVFAPPSNVCVGQTPPPNLYGDLRFPTAGLIDRGQVSAVNMPEPPKNTLYYVCRRQRAISGIVVNDTWQDLQPQREGQPIRVTTIEKALREVRAYNGTPGRLLTVRLRIWGGIDAPAWAKRIGGPISICDQDALPCPRAALRTVGAFWSRAYEEAWQDVQQQLAARYDRDRTIGDVAVTSCDSLTDEPFVQPEDAYSKANLLRAGYTDARYKTCLADAVARDYLPFWNRTWLVFSFNPFRMIQQSPPSTDLAFTKATIVSCRQHMPRRCVLNNQTLGKFTPPPSPAPRQTPSLAQDYYAMWRFMRAQGSPISFQTASSLNLTAAWGSSRAGWNAAAQLAHRFGASSLELWPPERVEPCTAPNRDWLSGYTCFSTGKLLQWKSGLAPPGPRP